MTIRGLDPSGELGRLFFQIQSKDIHAQEPNPSRTTQRYSAADAVDLSVLAQEIRDYSSRASQFPEIRVDKIKRIQQALEAGTELATSGQLAEAITRETILNALGS
jgi:anti-sigma28 factor (negative regulator of flagellin synthesis)